MENRKVVEILRNKPPFMKVPEVRDLLRIDHKQAYEFVEREDLGVRVGPRTIRVVTAKLVEYCQEHDVITNGKPVGAGTSGEVTVAGVS